MPGKERRLSPRRDCMIPLRFRILANSRAEYAVAGAGGRLDWPEGTAGHFGPLDGEAINLSAGGIGFKSREKLAVGDRLEMYLTIPPSFTGRNFESVRCKAHVVHVENRADVRGLTGIGATVEMFEEIAVSQVRYS